MTSANELPEDLSIMGWKKRAGEHVMAARNALDEADEVIASDVASRNKIDVLVKHISKGLVASALALAEAYSSVDADAKRAMRVWVGADVVDAAVALAVARGGKKEAA
jgi:hypothetical protein